MKYEDKYRLTPEENRRFAKANLTKLVFTSSRFEGVTTTMPQTQTIIDGMGVDGVSIDDINTIVQLKRGWQFAINYSKPVSLELEKDLNKIVARDTAAYPGYLRNGSGGVDTYRGEFKPPMVSEGQEKEYLDELLNNSNLSTTDKALTLMYHNMRQQMFYDGNKRTATIMANKVMIDGGAGLINVPIDTWPTWQKKIADFYFSNDMTDIKDWTYHNGIFGMEPNLEARKEYASQQLTPKEVKQNIKEYNNSQQYLKKRYYEQEREAQNQERNNNMEL